MYLQGLKVSAICAVFTVIACGQEANPQETSNSTAHQLSRTQQMVKLQREVIQAQQEALSAKLTREADVYQQAISEDTDSETRAIAALTDDPTILNRAELLSVYNTQKGRASDPIRDKLIALVKGLLVQDNLIAPFAAVVDAATELTSSGNSDVQSAKGSNQPQGRGMIRFESPHWGWQSKYGLDLSVRGQFGYIPALTLVNLTNGTTPIAPSPRTLYQQGFNWGFRPQVGYATGDHGELMIFGEYGENILPDTVTSFSQSNATITATTVANGPQNNASYWQSGLEYKLFTHTLGQTHLDQKFFNPLFSANVSYKNDSRFQRSGDLKTLKNPAERLEFGFMVTLTNITGFKDDSVPASGVNVEFGVQREAPLGNSIIPPATRIIIRSTLDILKLLNPQK